MSASFPTSSTNTSQSQIYGLTIPSVYSPHRRHLPPSPFRTRSMPSNKLAVFYLSISPLALVVPSFHVAAAPFSGNYQHVNGQASVSGSRLGPTIGTRATSSSKSVIIQMFEWTWDSVASECTSFIGPAGYGYVQGSSYICHTRARPMS